MTENTKTSSSSGLAILAIVLVILSLTGVAGIAYMGMQYIEKVAKLESGLDAAQQQRSADKEELQELAKANQGLMLQLKHNSERLAELPGAERHDWLLAEAEYLLRLANQRLNLENDADGALAMLKAADNVLLETGNPLLDKVRSVIAQEIQAVRAVPAVDLTGAIARIQALQGQIDQLEWMPRTVSEPQVSEVVSEEPQEESRWLKAWSKTKAALSSIVRIRDHEEPLVAPLSPDQHYYLQQNMHLMLEQAQVALARQNPDLYAQSIERTQKWLQQFVMMKTANTKAAIAGLEELKAWQVAPQFPTISGSLQALRQLVEQQKRAQAVVLKSEAVAQ